MLTFIVLGGSTCSLYDSISSGHAEANSDEFANFAEENS